MRRGFVPWGRCRASPRTNRGSSGPQGVRRSWFRRPSSSAGLGNRATPLTASDLVKNLLFRSIDDASSNIHQLYDEHWRPFEGRWWRAEQTQGRYKRKRLDIFLSHYLAWRLERDVTVPELYSTYRSMLVSSGDDPVAHLQDLSRAGRLYRGMLAEPFHSPEGQFFYRLRVMDTTTVQPLLLELYSEHEHGRLDRHELQRCLTALDSYLVRRLLCRLTSKNYNRSRTWNKLPCPDDSPE